MSPILKILKKHARELTALGIDFSDTDAEYFCTPKGASIIGSAGVDGIHYCTVKAYGECIFAVSPSNLPGDYIHPIASSVGDFVSLILSSGGCDSLEQLWMWDRDGFSAYIKENPPSEETANALALLSSLTGIAPHDDPYSYVKSLQASLDLSKLKFEKGYEIFPE